MTQTLSIFLRFMRFFFTTSLLLIILSQARGQDWKGYYDQAVADYQSEHYPEAMMNAEKAFEASKSLDLKNIESVWVTSQDFFYELIVF